MRIFTLAALAANMLLWWAFLLWPPSSFSWTARPTIFALVATVVSAAAAIALARDWWLARLTPSAEAAVPESRVGWISALAIAIAGALLLAGVLTKGARPVPAALILMLGAGALFTIIATAERLIAGSEVEVSSHWGGLGGSLGGWRISQTAILLLLALILVSATVMAGNGLTAVETNRSVETNSSGTTDAVANDAEAEANEAGPASNVAANEQGNATANEAVANVSGGGT